MPLSSVATFRYELEQPTIWRRDRIPTITIKAGIGDATQPATIVKALSDKVAAFEKTMPAGYSVEVGGAVEESAKSQGPIAKVAPAMFVIMATLLMIQLQSFHRLFLVFSVAPLALIGVVVALLSSNAPLGFVALLGVLALVGILIRNSVILIVQIEELRAEGMSPWKAVVEATEHRMRPIMLTAAAATLALIPISHEIFWGPMAYAMMGGIVVGTALTLLFLPALYVAWFRIPRESRSTDDGTPLLERLAQHLLSQWIAGDRSRNSGCSGGWCSCHRHNRMRDPGGKRPAASGRDRKRCQPGEHAGRDDAQAIGGSRSTLFGRARNGDLAQQRLRLHSARSKPQDRRGAMALTPAAESAKGVCSP